MHLLSWQVSLVEQSLFPRHPLTHWTPWQISSELQSPSFRQISWHTFWIQSSFERQFPSLLQIGLQNLWLQTNPGGHCVFAAQVEGSRTQPTTAVGLGKKPSRQEHCARCPLTVVKKEKQTCIIFSYFQIYYEHFDKSKLDDIQWLTLTFRVWSAGGWISTRINTSISNTRLGCWTIGIDLATNQAHVIQANVPEETIIVQSTSQHTLSVLTPFVRSTLCIRQTFQHADSINTVHLVGTALIWDTSIWNSDTFNFSVSGERWRTGTSLFVFDCLTLGIESTWVSICTRCLTLTIDTYLARFAIDVGQTTSWNEK